MTSKLKLQVDQLHKGSAGLKILLACDYFAAGHQGTNKIPLPQTVFGTYASVKAGKEAELGSEEPGNREREMPQNLFWSDRSFQPRGHLASAQKSQTLPVCRSRNEVSRPRLSPLVRN